MNSELTDVVEALADKVGVAAQTLRPVAEETIRQVQVRGAVQVLCGGFLFLLCAGTVIVSVRLIRCWMREKDSGGYYGMSRAEKVACTLLGGFLVAGLLFIAGAVTVSAGLAQWLAPLPTVLGL